MDLHAISVAEQVPGCAVASSVAGVALGAGTATILLGCRSRRAATAPERACQQRTARLQDAAEVVGMVEDRTPRRDRRGIDCGGRRFARRVVGGGIRRRLHGCVLDLDVWLRAGFVGRLLAAVVQRSVDAAAGCSSPAISTAIGGGTGNGNGIGNGIEVEQDQLLGLRTLCLSRSAKSATHDAGRGRRCVARSGDGAGGRRRVGTRR